MAEYRLTYFPGNGRAVIARAILSYGKANWENVLMNREDWPKIKKSGLCEFEQVPVLEHNGKKMAQSMAIDLYLARKFNLMGKDDDENYQIESLLCCYEDIITAIGKAKHCPDDAQKAKFMEEAEKKYAFFLGKIEERYVRNGCGKYFMGDRFTLCDIFCGAALCSACDAIGKCIIKENAPKLFELVKRIKEGELKEFHEKYFIKSN